jgi:uncharacterized membrane protein
MRLVILRQRAESWDLGLVALLALAAMSAVLLGLQNVFLRAVLTIPLLLLLPGYVLTEALFAGGLSDAPRRLLLVPGLSLAVAVLGGLLLYLMPWGLRAEPWALFLGVTTLAGCVAAYSRRAHQETTPSLHLRAGFTGEQLFVFALAILITTGALLTARVGAERQAAAPFTEFWVLPDQSNGRSIRLGIHNAERETVTYMLEVEVLDTRAEWSEIEVQPGETWETTFNLPRPALARAPVDARLYRADRPGEVYRRGDGWLPELAPGD